jgi:signal transduction histidine kinase
VAPTTHTPLAGASGARAPSPPRAGAIDDAAGRQSRIVEELLFLARADAGRLAHDVGQVRVRLYRW